MNHPRSSCTTFDSNVTINAFLLLGFIIGDPTFVDCILRWLGSYGVRKVMIEKPALKYSMQSSVMKKQTYRFHSRKKLHEQRIKLKTWVFKKFISMSWSKKEMEMVGEDNGSISKAENDIFLCYLIWIFL